MKWFWCFPQHEITTDSNTLNHLGHNSEFSGTTPSCLAIILTPDWLHGPDLWLVGGADYQTLWTVDTLWCILGTNNNNNNSLSVSVFDSSGGVSLTQSRRTSPPPLTLPLPPTSPPPTSGCVWVFGASQTLTDWLMDWTAVSWWDYRNAASSSGDAAAKRNIQQPRCQPAPPPPPPTTPPTYPGISDVGEINAGMEAGGGRGDCKPLAKPSEIFLLLSLLFRFCLCPLSIPRPEFFGSASNPRRPHGFSRSHYSQWGCKDFQIKVKEFSLWRKHEGFFFF